MFFPLRDDNPRHSFPVVAVAIIAINVIVQIYQSMMSPERVAVFLSQVGAIPLELTTLTDIVRFPDHATSLVPIPLTIFTAMFVHGGWMHLISNMWYLWLFGDNIEDAMGRVRFIIFYLLCGVAAAVAQVVAAPSSLVPMIGASGAVAGVLGAYLVRFPHARIHTFVVLIIFIQFIEVPALIVLGLWFLLQVLNSLAPQSPFGGVAWFAHVGGFIAGLILIRIFAPKHVYRR